MEIATPRLMDDVRGVRYGEVIAVFLRESGFEAEVFGTQMLNDCPPALWDTLDAATIAAGLGAVAVKLNGPRHWMIDGLGQKVAVADPVLRDFNGLTMRRIALIDLGMPGLNGLEVAARIRAELGSSIYLVALTGYSRESDIAATRAAGFDQHLVKSGDPRELIQALRAVR